MKITAADLTKALRLLDAKPTHTVALTPPSWFGPDPTSVVQLLCYAGVSVCFVPGAEALRFIIVIDMKRIQAGCATPERAAALFTIALGD